jgi:imidazole glycerol phosphate synthase subunit HisF
MPVRDVLQPAMLNSHYHVMLVSVVFRASARASKGVEVTLAYSAVASGGANESNQWSLPRLMPRYVVQVEPGTFEKLGDRCAEFLVHGVDVEGRQLGVDEELVSLLGKSVAIPTTYAGGVTTMVCSSRYHVMAEMLLHQQP